MATSSPAEMQQLEAHKTDTQQPNIIAALIVCSILAYTAVALRLFARHKQKVNLGADDWWIMGALIPSTVWVGLKFWSIHSGLGLHIVRVANVEMLVKSAIACEAVYGCCLPPIKLSILALYHRLFPSRRLYHVALFIAAIVIGTGITQTVGFSSQCVPLSKAWTGGPGKCISSGAFATSMAVLTIITDVAILCLPIPSLSNLQVPKVVRAGLIGTFALGGCVCVFSIVRAIKVGTASQEDPSWNDAPGGTWTIIEIHVAIVSACLPTLRPLFPKGQVRRRDRRSKHGASDKILQDTKGLEMTAWTESSNAAIAHSQQRSDGFTRLDEEGLPVLGRGHSDDTPGF